MLGQIQLLADLSVCPTGGDKQRNVALPRGEHMKQGWPGWLTIVVAGQLVQPCEERNESSLCNPTATLDGKPSNVTLDVRSGGRGKIAPCLHGEHETVCLLITLAGEG